MDNTLLKKGYFGIQKLPCGTTALRNYLDTTDIVVGIRGNSYLRRYSYDSESLARRALEKWDGNGDPSGPWLKCKGPEELRIGPGWNNLE